MTDEIMNLHALVEKGPDAELLGEMIGFATQRLMELEVEGQTGAGYGEKSPERLAQPMGERPHECGPEGFGLGGADVELENLAPAIAVDAACAT